jgi:hypothetical protein
VKIDWQANPNSPVNPMKHRIRNGLFWYKNEATYLRFREIISDPEQIASPYSKWVSDTEEKIEGFAKRGIHLVKIKADPDEFLAWCKINSRKPDGRARSIFAGIKFSSVIGNG